MSKPETNIEFVTRLMDFSQQGALMQMFIITAIEKYGAIIEAADESEWNTDFINFGAWQRCAIEARENLEART